MLKRDYVMKLVQQMLDALFLLLNEKGLDDADRQEHLERFYIDYVGESREFYMNCSLNDIVSHLTLKYEGELLQRLDMLSEIMYQDGMLEEDALQKKLILQNTLSILQYLSENDNTYSLIRQGKIDSVTAALLD